MSAIRRDHMEKNFWTQRAMGGRNLSRRAVLRGGALGLVGLGAAALIGCGDDDEPASSGSTGGGATGAASPAVSGTTKINRGGTIRMGTRKFPPGMDPDHTGTGYHMQRVAFDSLIGFDPAGVPGVHADSLADSMEIQDETTLVLGMKKGVKFHDGTDFNAESVKWNFDRTLGESEGASVFKGQFASLDRVEIIDDFTVRFILAQPDASLPAALGYNGAVMLSPTHYDGKSNEDVQWDPVGTGRYRFKSHSQDSSVTWEPFKDHFYKLADGGSSALLDELSYVSVPDAVVQVASLEAGDLEVIEESPEDQLDLLDSAGLKGVALEGFAVRDFYINHDLAPMDNVDFRRALMWAIDKDSWNNIFFGGRNSAATSVFEPASWAHIDVPGFPGYDMEKAKKYMAQSGIPVSERKILGTARAGSQTEEWQFAQAAWAELGVEMTYVESKEAGSRSNRNQGEVGDIHASLSRFTHKTDPNLMAGVIFRQDSIYNYCGCPTLGMEELILKATRTYDVEERKAFYAEAQKLHADQLGNMLPMVNLSFWVHGRKDVVGMGHMADGRGDYRNLGFAAS
jgi:peptide/nickel transport system substrate-binding protein